MNIPAAEKFLDAYLSVYQVPWSPEVDDMYGAITTAMVEFTKSHVEAALKAALESIPCLGSSSDIATYDEVEKEVLNAYPLTNIK